MHKSYEELCALAATGQITGDAMKVLDQHLRACSICRAFLEDLVPLKDHVTPVVAGSRIHSYTPPEGIRARFLQKAAAAGLELTPGAPIDVSKTSEIPFPEQRPVLSEQGQVGTARSPDWFAAPRFAAPLLAGLLCGVLGFTIARHESRHEPIQAAVAPPVQVPSNPIGQASAQIDALRQQNNDAKSRLAALSANLARARNQKQDLEKRLADLAQRVDAGDQLEQRFKEVSAQLEQADAREAKLKSDLEAERGRTATAEAAAVAQQKETEEASSRVATLESQLDRLRELDTGKGLAGDLISARNLHIVDVYDTEPNGERKRAFGRVFFVEGKSLVFYAYDLPNSRRGDKKIEFRVWGEQAGIKSVSINLGSMRTDNANLGRWVLTCDDPKVLKRINAVYVTADANPRSDPEPRGPKLMYAFLGSPNHP